MSPCFWHNGQYPDSEEYKALLDGRFADYRLRINGLVDNPVELDLVQLRALPHHEQITPGDLVPFGNQQRHELDADHPTRAGNEDPHHRAGETRRPPPRVDDPSRN
jgi:hypothetical protein